MERYSINGKHVLVTGASGGLGSALVRNLAEMGAKLVVTSRSIKALNELISLLPESTQAEAITADLSRPGEAEILAHKAIKALGYIDVLFNNAGVGYFALMEEATEENIRQLFEVNTFSPLALIKALLPKMKAKGDGRIINIGSVTCVFGYAGLAPYCASRGGIKQLTMSLADDWGVYGITVNCLAPGWFKTEQTAVLYENEEWVEYLCDRIPLKRPGQPNDLDGAIVFLASDASEYITGQTLLVDGGISTGATKATV